MLHVLPHVPPLPHMSLTKARMTKGSEDSQVR